MARMAEEVARQTAEMAIRQLASEGQSIKLSLGSQDLLEEPEAEYDLVLNSRDRKKCVRKCCFLGMIFEKCRDTAFVHYDQAASATGRGERGGPHGSHKVRMYTGILLYHNVVER